MAAKKWTFLAYLAGDNSLDEEGVKDINEMAKVGSNPDLNIVVQFDRAGNLGTRRFYVTKNGGYDKDSIQELGQTNTGDPKVLGDFLTWGIKNYPAEHYMIVLWNHGSGWKEDDIYDRARKLSPEGEKISTFEKRKIAKSGKKGIKRSLFCTTVEEIVKLEEQMRGIAYDDGSKDFLDNREMKKVLKSALNKTKVKKFDVIGFDACLMNMVEVGYQIRGLANIAVGSQETEPGEGWPYDKILAALAKKPEMGPGELVKTVVDEYVKSYDIGARSPPVTQSGVSLSKVEGIRKKVDSLADNLISKIENKEVLDAVTLSAYYTQHFYDNEYLDLYDFARLMGENSPDAKIKAAAKDLNIALKISQHGFILASKYLTKAMENAHGVSIYFPGRSLYSPFYNNLDFSKRGRWEDFIKAYQTEYDKTRGR